MKFKLLCLISFFIALVRCEEEDGVLLLDPQNFKSMLEDKDLAFVMFYDAKCQHSKKMMPHLHKAAQQLKSDNQPVQIGKLDCSKPGADEFCDQHEISATPTTILFRKGHRAPTMKDPREVEAIVEYLKGQVGPAIKKLGTTTELDDYLRTINGSVIAFMPPHHRMMRNFADVAEILRDDYHFANVPDAEVTLAKNHNTKGAIVVYPAKAPGNDTAPAPITYTDNDDSPEGASYLLEWVEDNYFGSGERLVRDEEEEEEEEEDGEYIEAE